MAVTNQELFNIFLANPNMSDAQIVSLMETRGISPEQVSSTFGIPVNEVVSRASAVVPAGSSLNLGGTPIQSQFKQKYVIDYQGTEFDPATILKLSKQITASIDPNAIKGGVFSTKGESVGFNYDEATRLLGKAPTATEQVVLDMARHLAKEGVTDLKDANLTETNRRFGSTFTGGGGTIYEIKKNAEGNPVISTWSKDTSDKKTILAGLAIAALAFGIPGVTEGLLSSAPAGATLGTTAITATEAAGLGLTATEAASLGLSATEFAAASATAAGAGGGLLTGGAGATAAGAEAATAFELANAGIVGGAASFTPAQLALIEAGATAAEVAAAGTSAGLLTGGKTAAELAALDLATGGVGGSTGATSLANALATGADVSTVTSLTGGSGVLTGAAAGITAESVAAKLAADKVIADAALAKKVTDTASLLTGGLKTVGGLLQTEEDKAAAKLAADKVTAATQAGVEGSQFRPVGMTTRFGTSNYTYDPVTGRMTSAGYQLSPEAKNAQDRLVKLAESGLVQAEGAQAQFAPLQTGAQSLFSLGNQYISQSPQDVAQNYLNQQMQLLQPGRELELANLQNKLYQQGRTGVSVAQGGSLGATTPELQALYNARARQEAELAANAQQLGQRDVLFGAGLLGQGATAMGNYYGGQQAAYSPFTNALGQIQNLETQAQQPLTMGANLAQQASTAGFNAGRLGLQGASAAADLTTGKAATTNPYASLLSGIDPAFAAGIAKQIWGG